MRETGHSPSAPRTPPLCPKSDDESANAKVVSEKAKADRPSDERPIVGGPSDVPPGPPRSSQVVRVDLSDRASLEAAREVYDATGECVHPALAEVEDEARGDVICSLCGRATRADGMARSRWQPASAPSANVAAKGAEYYVREAMIDACGAPPLTPTPLSPSAAMTPATCVP